jgi:multidrug efflux pump subunit AcrA (membrane-fusion protein)
MSSAKDRPPGLRSGWLLAVGVILLLALVVMLGPGLVKGPATATPDTGHADHGHGHEHADDEHAADMIEVSEAARRAIGIQVKTAKLNSFVRTISVPGIVVARPGRSTVQVTAPMTGIVTRIVPTEGEAVTPGQVLFEIRLLHEEVVQAQADLLRTAEELDVIGREIARLDMAVTQSDIPGKTVLERQYDQQKQQAMLHSQRQALMLHGFAESQIEGILKTRKLVQVLTVRAPELKRGEGDGEGFHQVQQLLVSQGQYVTGGQTLAVLADHRELFIEGDAFERDLDEIQRAHAAGQRVSATLEAGERSRQPLTDLPLLYIASQVDETARTLHFYVGLPNSIAHDSKLADGRRYVAWKYRPGQRALLQVPVETWEGRIVLPADAVAQDGAETFAFVVHGEHFDRRAVQIAYKDPSSVVLAKGGGIQPGDRVVMSGAKQLWMALKNKSGGAIDPHAGHNH